MSKITVKRSKRNPDFFLVKGGGFKTVSTMSKAEANRIKKARQNIKRKRTKRKHSKSILGIM